MLVIIKKCDFRVFAWAQVVINGLKGTQILRVKVSKLRRYEHILVENWYCLLLLFEKCIEVLRLHSVPWRHTGEWDIVPSVNQSQKIDHCHQCCFHCHIESCPGEPAKAAKHQKKCLEFHFPPTSKFCLTKVPPYLPLSLTPALFNTSAFLCNWILGTNSHLQETPIIFTS